MLELLNICLNFIMSLLQSIWLVITLSLSFVCDILMTLHLEMPRLEGLLVGVLLAWLMLRRDKHPVIRILSSPLKLILDILDLAWDQCVEVARDGWGTLSGWTKSSWGIATNPIKGLWKRTILLLNNIKSKLSKD